MATPSSMLALGSTAPTFALPDTVSGREMGIDDLLGACGLLVMFLCNHCPYVQHVLPELLRLGRNYLPRGVGFVAISSNDAKTYPEDGPEAMQREAKQQGFPFPYLYDSSQSVARAYEAACTPDFFLFDAQRRLVYRGRLDDSTPRNGKSLTGVDLRAALDALVRGTPIPSEQHPSLGCSIKWVNQP